MTTRFDNVFEQIDSFEQQIANLEKKINLLEKRIEHLIQIERNHLIRVKNHEEISDEFIHSGRKYQDLTPEKAFKFYSNRDFVFILLDVSAKGNIPTHKLPEAIHIPWEEFKERYFEIQNKTTPILVISEDGTNSVLACEFLVSNGYYNCNNVSGGYKFWKAEDLKEVLSA